MTSCGAACGACSARASAPCTRCAAWRRSPPRRSSGPGCTTTCERRDRPVRRDRRRARLPGRAGGAADADLGYAIGRDEAGPGGDAHRTRRAAGRSSSATSSTAARTRPACCAWSWAWSRAGDALCVPGNHEDKLLRALRGRERAGQPRAGRVAGAARRGAAGVPRRRRAVPGRPDLALRAGRRQARRLARRADSSATRAGPRGGSASSACTGRRPARPTSTACRSATRGRRSTAAGRWCSTATRPVPDAGVDQQHALPGHRLRVRRPADRAALPGAGDSSPCRRRGSTTSRPGRSRPTKRAAGAGSDDVAGRREPDVLDITDVLGTRVIETRVSPAHRRARGERRRRAGGDEPVRDRPALAGLPAADDEPGRDLGASRTCSSTRSRRSSPTARDGVDQVVCEEKHMGSRARGARVPAPAAAATARFGAPAGAGRAPSGRAPGGRSSART